MVINSSFRPAVDVACASYGICNVTAALNLPLIICSALTYDPTPAAARAPSLPKPDTYYSIAISTSPIFENSDKNTHSISSLYFLKFSIITD
jgi:hypothetical protein